MSSRQMSEQHHGSKSVAELEITMAVQAKDERVLVNGSPNSKPTEPIYVQFVTNH